MFSFFKTKRTIPAEPVKLSHQELRERKWERLQRNKLRWGVIRHFVIYDELINSFSLYDVRKLLSDLNSVQGIIDAVPDYELSEIDFDVINRFEKYKQNIGECDIDSRNTITYQNYLNIRDLDKEKCLIIVYENFESYWDDVLNSYKRNTERKNRLQSLIDNLNKDLVDPLTDYESVRLKLSSLLRKYRNWLRCVS